MRTHGSGAHIILRKRDLLAIFCVYDVVMKQFVLK